MGQHDYAGRELDIFRAAVNWKHYWGSHIWRYITGNVLEVGAGCGNNTLLLLAMSMPDSWTCVEPDPTMAAQLADFLRQASPPARNAHVISGMLQDVPADATYHSILYVDVLEHIEDDAAEVAQAAAKLSPGGYLIIVAPALPQLYSEFDRALGHYRRYTLTALKQLTPPRCRIIVARYLDSAGMLLSGINRLLLRQSLPTHPQIRFWDTVVIPVSKVCDRFLRGKIGKTAVMIWQKESA